MVDNFKRVVCFERREGMERKEGEGIRGRVDGNEVVAEVGSKVQGSSDMRSSLIFERLLLNYKQAACYLSVSEPYLRRLKARGRVPFVELGTGQRRAVRFNVKSLERWVESREIK